MAVAKFRSSSCFDAVSNACVAVERGNAQQAAVLFHSVGNDAKLLQRESRKYCQTLEQLELQQEIQIEQLTYEINDLYQKERNMEVQERNLKSRRGDLEAQIESDQRQVEEAERRYERARARRDEAAEKYDTAKSWWWVPVWGWYIGIEELIEDNEGRARDAQRDMNRHRSDIDYAQRNFRYTNEEISKVHDEINYCHVKRQRLKEKRNFLREQVGSIKGMITFLMEATTFWDQVGCLSDNATVRSSQLEKIMNIASKKNTLKILTSRGTKTLMGSFKECWNEIEDMMRSDDVVFAMENLSLE